MINFLIQSTLCWTVLYLVYWFFLKDKTFYAANRWYLLGITAVGLAFPGIIAALSQIDEVVLLSNELPTVYVTWMNVSELPTYTLSSTYTTAPIWDWVAFLQGIYLLGLAICLLRLLAGLWQIQQIYRSGERTRYHGYRIIQSSSVQSPFSFFRWIFINPTQFKEQEAQETILKHEQAHIQLGHSYDVLGLELLTAILWFNPILHFIKRAIKNVHEYQADASVVKDQPVQPYGQLLLYQAKYSNDQIVFANYFFSTQIKKRIMMMTRIPSSKQQGWLYFLAVPALLLMGIFTLQNSAQAAPIKLESIERAVDPETDPDEMPVFAGCAAEGDAETIKECSMKALFKHVGQNLKYPKAAKNAGTEGMVVIGFTVDKDGQVVNAKIEKEIGEGCGAEALRIVQSMPLWTPGKKDGKTVAVEMKLPFKFKLDDKDAKVYQDVQQMPVFAGCDAENLEGDALKSCSNSKLFAFIGKEMRYPELAAKNGVEGMVIVSFVVEKDGSVSNLKALKGIGSGSEEEVLRVIYSMPNWTPGQKDGKAVRTEMRLPVKFVLDNAEEMNKKPLTSDLTLADFRLGPNPTKDQIDLQFKSDAKAISIRVFDLNGKVIYTEQDQNFTGFYQNSIALNGAPEGTYFVQVRQDGKAMTRKIVKQ